MGRGSEDGFVSVTEVFDEVGMDEGRNAVPQEEEEECFEPELRFREWESASHPPSKRKNIITRKSR